MGLQGNVDDWRSDMLERLAEYERLEFDRFSWLTGNDQHVCAKCRAREGRIYTAAEIRKELEGEFCTPGDPDDRCRCVIIVE